jgi:hypothetical protein
MQKALTQMNIQLANVLSDLTGMTGQLIIKAILSGARDPHKLAAFRDHRVKASEERWRPAPIFPVCGAVPWPGKANASG